MVRIAAILACLLLVLTFNAYACILPVPQPAEMDCSSGTTEPVRGTCDAFLELGPQSPFSSSNTFLTFQLESSLPIHLVLNTFVPLVYVTDLSPRTNPSLHCSIQTTVLRI